MEKQRTYKVAGDIDHHSADSMKKDMDTLITREKPTRFIVDFKKADIMDSAGIGLLIGRYKRLQKYGGRMYAKNMSTQVKKAFKIAGLQTIISEEKRKR